MEIKLQCEKNKFELACLKLEQQEKLAMETLHMYQNFGQGSVSGLPALRGPQSASTSALSSLDGSHVQL